MRRPSALARTCAPLALAVSLFACSSNGGPSPAGDSAPSVDITRSDLSADLAPVDARKLDAGPPCGGSCPAGQLCIDGLCCHEPAASGTFVLPAHTSYIHWKLASGGIAKLRFTIEVHNDPGASVGLYFAPMSGQIDGTTFYLGMQTMLSKPGVGSVGKGLLFSHWGSFSAADTRTAPGGFIELGTHEGTFIGVRLTYPWKVGSYALVLERAEQSGGGDWFDLRITDLASGEETYIGGLRFARADPIKPAQIQPAGIAFTEVYQGATDYAQVPQWHLGVMAEADGAPAASASSEYPAFPYAEYPNTDVFYEASTSMIHLIFGGQTPRCHPAGLLF